MQRTAACGHKLPLQDHASEGGLYAMQAPESACVVGDTFTHRDLHHVPRGIRLRHGLLKVLAVRPGCTQQKAAGKAGTVGSRRQERTVAARGCASTYWPAATQGRTLCVHLRCKSPESTGGLGAGTGRRLFTGVASLPPLARFRRQAAAPERRQQDSQRPARDQERD